MRPCGVGTLLSPHVEERFITCNSASRGGRSRRRAVPCGGRGPSGPLVLPHARVREVLVVAPRLALGRLVLLAEVPAARLLAVERVAAHQLAELEEVGDASGLLEGLVEVVGAARDPEVLPEALPDLGDRRERPLETRPVARHAALVPHHAAELDVEAVRRPRAPDREQAPRATPRPPRRPSRTASSVAETRLGPAPAR